MVSLKSIFLTCTLFVAMAGIYAQIPPGSNAYLPPIENGYKYNVPDMPFKPGTPGTPGTPSRPTPPRPTPPRQPPTRPTNGQRPGTTPDDHVHMPGNPYEFEYSVNDIDTANDYNHKASSDGDVVTGEYRVQLPDGRTQVVRYTADWKTGYHAEVSYEGEAQYPQGPAGYKY